MNLNEFIFCKHGQNSIVLEVSNLNPSLKGFKGIEVIKYLKELFCNKPAYRSVPFSGI